MLNFRSGDVVLETTVYEYFALDVDEHHRTYHSFTYDCNSNTHINQRSHLNIVDMADSS